MNLSESVAESVEGIKKAIELGIAFIKHNQCSDGEIPVFCFCDKKCPSLKRDSNVFGTIQSIHSLSFTNHSDAELIRKHASEYVLLRMEYPGVWRYWKDREIPPDLDDTACASKLLGTQHPLLLIGANVPLFYENLDENARFKTWLGQDRNDVDSVVNANIVWFLGHNRHTESAIQWIIDVIRTDREEESYWYYEDPFALYYAVSRAIRAGVKPWLTLREAIREKIINRFHHGSSKSTSIICAQALCTLNNLSYQSDPVSSDIALELLKRQYKDGSWELSAAWSGPRAPAPRAIWWGSKEYTTCLCVEALSHYLNPSNLKDSPC